jgi:putative integral membrane protein (TIGR02587 family)
VTNNRPQNAASQAPSTRSATRHFWIGLARACGGAIIFSLPLMMTMEMWWLGFYMSPLRLALLLLLTLPLLVGLSYYSGFEETFCWQEEVVDAFVAYGVGFVAPAVLLVCMGVLDLSMPLAEVIGKVSLQAVPGSIGAMLARSLLGSNREEEEQKKQHSGYGGEMFLMIVGALFLAFNVAPTEEMVLIALQMTNWHAIALAAVSLVIMHGFVYAIEFQGQESIPLGTPFWSVFLRFTVAGYALSLLISLYVLWTFERTSGVGLEHVVMMTVVLGFPAAVGAAAARLII